MDRMPNESKTRQNGPVLWGILSILSMLVFACLDEKDECGNDMTIYEMPVVSGKPQIYCTPKIVDTGSLPNDTDEIPSDDGDASVSDSGDDIDNGLPSGMGNSCEGSGEGTTCTGEADYCNQPPGYPGTCTISGCTLSPDNCPKGYYCFDLSVYAENLPTICEENLK